VNGLLGPARLWVIPHSKSGIDLLTVSQDTSSKLGDLGLSEVMQTQACRRQLSVRLTRVALGGR
jgi:hypothetical protein